MPKMKNPMKTVVVAALALVAGAACAAESLLSEEVQPVVARLDMEVAREGKPAEECAIVTRSGHEGEFKKVTEYISSDGSKSDMDMEQPTFTVHSLKQSSVLKPGKVWSVKGDGLAVNVKASVITDK